MISKSQKCAWLVSQNREAHRNRRTNLSMPTIGESADRQTNSTKEFYPINGRAESEQFTTSNLLRARRARSMKLPASSHHSLGAGLSRSFRRRSPAALEGSRKLQKNVHWVILSFYNWLILSFEQIFLLKFASKNFKRTVSENEWRTQSNEQYGKEISLKRKTYF